MGWSLYGQIDSVLFAECRYDQTLVEDADQRRKAKSIEQRAQHRDLVQQQSQIEELANEPYGSGSVRLGANPMTGKLSPTKRSRPLAPRRKRRNRSRGGLMRTGDGEVDQNQCGTSHH